VASLPPVPNIVLLGFGGNTSRWLRFNLDRHPQIFLPPLRSNFFASVELMEAKGVRWYREQYRGWNGEPLLGEHAPEYLRFFNRPYEVVERLRKNLPDARYVVVLDGPLDGFADKLRQHIRWGRLPADIDLEQYYRFEVEAEIGLQTVTDSIASHGVKALLNRFGDAVQVLLADDIRRDRAAAYREVLAHVGADVDQVPDDLDLVRYDDAHVVPLAPVSEAARQSVYAWFRQDVDVLAELLDRDLSMWDPGVGSTLSPQELIIALAEASREVSS
jgi:hypothetical protein